MILCYNIPYHTRIWYVMLCDTMLYSLMIFCIQVCYIRVNTSVVIDMCIHVYFTHTNVYRYIQRYIYILSLPKNTQCFRTSYHFRVHQIILSRRWFVIIYRVYEFTIVYITWYSTILQSIWLYHSNSMLTFIISHSHVLS